MNFEDWLREISKGFSKPHDVTGVLVADFIAAVRHWRDVKHTPCYEREENPDVCVVKVDYALAALDKHYQENK